MRGVASDMICFFIGSLGLECGGFDIGLVRCRGWFGVAVVFLLDGGTRQDVKWREVL